MAQEGMENFFTYFPVYLGQTIANKCSHLDRAVEQPELRHQHHLRGDYSQR